MNQKISITELTDLNEVERIVRVASESVVNAKRIGSVGGCGRVYVSLGKIRKGSKVEKIISRYFKLMSRPYSTYKQIYVGYDNASGLEWNMGELIAKTFNDNGISAYVDGDGD